MPRPSTTGSSGKPWPPNRARIPDNGYGGPLPSFPRKRESRTALPYDAAAAASNRRIPAYAGRTVGRPGRTIGAAAEGR